MSDSVTVDGEEFTIYRLANMADCHTPDSAESPGAKFLASVASGTDELIDRYREDKVPEDRYDDNGEIHEIADGAPDVYTYTRWQEFVDLCAYQEDISEWGPTDLDKSAGVALYQIARRLVDALLQELGPFDGSDTCRLRHSKWDNDGDCVNESCSEYWDRPVCPDCGSNDLIDGKCDYDTCSNYWDAANVETVTERNSDNAN